MEQTKIQEQNDETTDVLDDNGCKLVLHNDNVHTFDYVIEALMKICRHTQGQAEQCTILVHTKGKCVVKTGSYDELLPMHTALLFKQLTSEILK